MTICTTKQLQLCGARLDAALEVRYARAVRVVVVRVRGVALLRRRRRVLVVAVRPGHEVRRLQQ